MQIISFWLVPIDEDKKYLDNIIETLAQKYSAPVFPPHITMHGSAATDRETAIKAASESIQDIKPFEVSVNKLNYSEDFFKTVFIEIKENDFLNSINERLQTKFQGNYIFKPHISLIYKKMSTDQKKGIIESLEIKTKFTINEIIVATPGNNKNDWFDIEDWEIVDRKQLG